MILVEEGLEVRLGVRGLAGEAQLAVLLVAMERVAMVHLVGTQVGQEPEVAIL